MYKFTNSEIFLIIYDLENTIPMKIDIFDINNNYDQIVNLRNEYISIINKFFEIDNDIKNLVLSDTETFENVNKLLKLFSK